MKKGMIGKIIDEVFICTDAESCGNSIISANETFINEGEFIVDNVFKDYITLHFINEPETKWYLNEDDYRNVEFK